MKEYSVLVILPGFQVSQMSNNESGKKMIGRTSSIAQIYYFVRANRAVMTAAQLDTFGVINRTYRSTLKCSKNTDSKCFFE